MSKAGNAFLVIVFGLTCLGLVMTYSASAMFADQRMGHSAVFFFRQLTSALVGFAALFFCSYINPFWIRKYSKWGLLAAGILLILVFVPYIGRPAGGAHRWIRVPGFYFQPAEFVKLALCVYIADYLARKQDWVRSGRLEVFFGPSLVIGTLILMIIIQPDFGTVAMLIVMTAALFFVAGIRMRFFFSAAALMLPVIVALIAMKPYRVSRVITFLNPWADAKGSGFQIIQSFVAFGLGGFGGRGLGGSTQKLFYLPQSHTDFIFSIVGEELGFVGTACIVSLFLLLFYFGITISFRAKNMYLRLVSFGLLLGMILQSLVNMMVTTGMLPTKGLPLPFLSYGGSALVFNMVAVGMILAVDRRTVSKCALS